MANNSALAEHVMQWAYDLIVLDPYGRFGKKVTESLLDGILSLMECLVVFREGSGNQDMEWAEMAKMALDILLKCAGNTEEPELCAMAAAKLHSLVQTRRASTLEENAYLIFRLSQVMITVLESDLYSFLSPVMKALLDKAKAQLHLTAQLPSLNLQHQSGPSFYEHFKEVIQTEEWSYFIEKKVQPHHDEHLKGFLTNLPTEMDVFWAECFELSKIASHKRSREVGESKLRFQARYMEPYLQVKG